MPYISEIENLRNVQHENLRSRHGPVVIGDILYDPKGSCGPRFQHDYQLVVIHHGALKLLIDTESVNVPAGQGILLSPGHREHFLFSADCETHHSWCAIDPKAVPTKLRTPFESNPGPIPFVGRMVDLLEICRRNQPKFEVDDPLESGFYAGVGLALFCDFILTVKRGSAKSTASDILAAELKNFIWEHYSQPLALLDIARGLGVSRQHLLKVCRLQNRPTPMSQLYAVRLQVATDLLQQTGISIAATAEKCGFVNVFHFSRKFKEAYGQSPGKWRKRLWETARK